MWREQFSGELLTFALNLLLWNCWRQMTQLAIAKFDREQHPPNESPETIPIFSSKMPMYICVSVWLRAFYFYRTRISRDNGKKYVSDTKLLPD
jgi:hypothetical protein